MGSEAIMPSGFHKDDTGDKDNTTVGLVLLGLICYGVYWLFKKCTSKARTVLVPVDQLNQHAQDAGKLSQLEAIAVSNVSKDFLGVEASIHSSARFRKMLVAVVVVLLAAIMFQFPRFYFTEPNHYGTLQVARTYSGASLDQNIKRAFRTMSLKMHPDKVPENEKEAAQKQFIVIKEAYDALGKSANRATYEKHGVAGLECKLDKSSMCNVKTSEGDDNPYMIHDIGGIVYYFCMSIVVVLATGNQRVTWTTQLVVVLMFVSTFFAEMSLRGFLGMESTDWNPVLGFDDLIKYEKALLCRCWFGLALAGALIIGALNQGATPEDVNRSYFNAILLQQSAMLNRISNQDATIEALTLNLKNR